VGTQLIVLPSSSVLPAGYVTQVERLAAEGGVQWEDVYVDISQNDPEIGIVPLFSQAKTLFKRWPGDPGEGRIELETARRWQVWAPGGTAVAPVWISLSLIFTYHAITYSVSGNITNSAGGTVDIKVCRAATGERVLETSRVGDGAYTLTWHDNTEELYAEARESATLLGRSDNALAA
jgi:hypothetical protein